jgi:hypothetical protein
MQLQLSEFYSKFKPSLDSWKSVSEFDPNAVCPWQSQLYITVNKMLSEHLSKLNGLKTAKDSQDQQQKIDRNTNNLKFALKNLEFESR